MTDTTFNGWTNYQTWNVALWLQNDEGLYHTAQRYRTLGYEFLANDLREMGSYETPDGVAWSDSGIDTEELNEMLAEL